MFIRIETLLSFFIVSLLSVTSAASAASEPEIKLVALDPTFLDLVPQDAKAEWIARDLSWAEGPVCLPNGRFIFSDIPNNRVMSWTPDQGLTTWLQPAHFQNGHAVDAEGRVLAASHGQRGIVRQTKSGAWETLVDKYQTKRLNSPNDLVVTRDGSIWFTDPSYGIENANEGYGGKVEQDGKYVFVLAPDTKKLTRLVTPEVNAPNGLAFSPDEKFLYVADSEAPRDKHNNTLKYQIFVYSVRGHELGQGRIFAQLTSGLPDGIKVDEQGNVWSSSAEGIYIFNSTGKLLGKIRIPAKVTSNLAFCTDPKGRNWVYITASQYSLRTPVWVKGATSLK